MTRGNVHPRSARLHGKVGERVGGGKTRIYISESRVGLAQGRQVAVLRFPSLQDGVAPLNPFDGRRGAQEDFLGLETAGAGVEDDALSCMAPG